MNVGIHGIGFHLPPTIRRNDWWPSHIVEKWREKAIAGILRAQQSPEPPASEGQRLAMEAMARVADDPFFGCQERRVLGDGMTSSDMELAAARDALARARVDAGEIDLLLTYSTTPRCALAPEFGPLHRELGLPRRCLSTAVDAVCNAFAMQMTLASQMIAAGRARYALLVQACLHSPLAPKEDVISSLIGDAATAVVLGPVRDGHGLLGWSHGTDGDLFCGLACGVPNGTWYDEGRAVPWSPSPRKGRTMMLNLPDWAKESVGEALAGARVAADEIDFYASHQATPWLRTLTRDFIGMGRARGIDIFRWTANLMACNVPLQLALGEGEGLLKGGDLVATFTGGTGVTWSGMVLRWGGSA